jgi:two-component system OmpR family response regulator/two-component system response regulator QseB
MRLLLVEDDTMLGASLKKGLGFSGYSVEWFKTGGDALAALQSGAFDLGIFDVNLPDMSGIDVLRHVRCAQMGKKMPVLMLTVNDTLAGKVSGLDAGADDYMTKPFDLEELLARLRALIRRKDGQTDNVLRARDLALNLETKNVEILEGGQTYTPTAKELLILRLLLQRPGGVVSKERMEEELYGWDGEVGSNTVEVLVYNLRKKLGKEIIVTLRGVGYMVMA